MTALWLLSPQTPMFFQGQEFAASTPFLYFADFSGQRRESRRAGPAQVSVAVSRRSHTEEARRAHARSGEPRRRSSGANSTGPSARSTAGVRPAPRSAQAAPRGSASSGGSVPIGSKRPRSATIAWSCAISASDGDEPASDRLLIVNFGRQLRYSPSPEPLLAPPSRLALGAAVVERGRALRRPAALRRRNGPTDGRSRAKRRSCSAVARPSGATTPRIRTRPFRRGPVSMSQRSSRSNRSRSPLTPAPATQSRPLDDEWLVTNGLGGLRVGHDLGRLHAALSRAVDRGPARPAGPTDDAQSSVGRDHLARRAHRAVGPRRASRRIDRRRGVARRIPARNGAAGLAIRRRALSARKTRADAPSAEHGLRYVSAAGGARAECGCGCGRRSIFAGTTTRSTSSMPRNLSRDRGRQPLRDRLRDVAPPLRMRIAAPQSGLLLDGGRIRQVRYRLEKARGYASVGSLWSPGYFRATLQAGEDAHA